MDVFLPSFLQSFHETCAQLKTSATCAPGAHEWASAGQNTCTMVTLVMFKPKIWRIGGAQAVCIVAFLFESHWFDSFNWKITWSLSSPLSMMISVLKMMHFVFIIKKIRRKRKRKRENWEFPVWWEHFQHRLSLLNALCNAPISPEKQVQKQQTMTSKLFFTHSYACQYIGTNDVESHFQEDEMVMQ